MLLVRTLSGALQFSVSKKGWIVALVAYTLIKTIIILYLVIKGFGKDFVPRGAFSAILNARLGNGFVGVTGLFVLLQYLLCVPIEILLSL